MTTSFSRRAAVTRASTAVRRAVSGSGSASSAGSAGPALPSPSRLTILATSLPFLVTPGRRRVQGLAQHQGRRDLVLARVPPGRAVAPVPQGPAFGPQRDLEVVGRAAHDRVDALESAAEPLDAGFARVARPLADRLTADAGEEGVDDRGGDHGGGAFFIAGRFSQIGVDDATAPPRHSGRTRRPLSRSYSRGIAVSGSPKAS